MTERYGHLVNEHRREYQRFLVQAINAERAAQGLTIKELARRAGIGERTLLRINGLERDLDFQQIEQIARALNVAVSSLTLAAEARRSGATAPPRMPTDPRGLILFHMDHPEYDDRLLTLLCQVEAQTGLRGEELQRLTNAIRSTRREELERALAALPSDVQADGA